MIQEKMVEFDKNHIAIPSIVRLERKLSNSFWSPTWSIGLNIGGNYPEVMASLRPLYVGSGFYDLNPGAVIPTSFKNASFSVSVVGGSHYHSAASTDVVIVIKRQ